MRSPDTLPPSGDPTVNQRRPRTPGVTDPEGGGQRSGPAEATVLQRIAREERAIMHLEPKWQECLAFFDNEQYVEVSAIDGKLDRLETREGGRGKPRHRIRLTRNRYTPAIVNECAALANRVPPPECQPINGDPDSTEACRLGEKALQSRYDELDVKGVILDMLQYAATTGAGFVWPYWNSNVGEFLVGPDGRVLREGEIGFHVLHQGEVMWQGGTDFYDSRYYIVRQAEHVDAIKARVGYTGPADIKPNAMSAPHERRRGEEARDLAYVYHYLERPSAQHIRGRWLQLCNGQLIAPEQPYPCDHDVPVLSWMPWIKRRHRQRPLGLGELMLDIQRTYNRTISQIVAYKNLVLVPQVFAPVGSLRQKMDDTPGAVWEFRPVGGMEPKWREMPDLPVGLFRTLDQCISDWAEITGQHSIPNSVESGAGVEARNARDESYRAVAVERLASAYSRIFMQMLYLMQAHYTEERLLIVQGRFGTSQVPRFKGAKLHGIAQVSVKPGKIAPRSKEAQQAIVMGLVDKGLVDPKKAIMALNAGTADALIDSYELDRDKQMREIEQLVQMGRMEGQGVPMVDPIADDHEVHLDVLTDWMKTVDFEAQPEMVKEAARAHAEWHRNEQQAQLFQAQLAQAGAAEQLGMANAGQPQQPKPMPSQPSMESSLRAAQGQPTRS